jgi:hypothetical protein
MFWFPEDVRLLVYTLGNSPTVGKYDSNVERTDTYKRIGDLQQLDQIRKKNHVRLDRIRYSEVLQIVASS